MAELIYYPQRGFGVLPQEDEPYDDAYFEHFKRVSATRQGHELNLRRAEFVNRYRFSGEKLCDVGVGIGAFIERCAEPCFGYDIAQIPCEWLHSRQKFFDLRSESIEIATLWDSLEHMDIKDATLLLGNVEKLCFIATPIYEHPDEIPSSKHFKPGEHILYFTDRGLLGFMRERGWHLIGRSDHEVECGREQIGAFAFERC